MTMPLWDIDPFSEFSLLQSLMSPEYRPNFLVVCGPAAAESGVERLAQSFTSPLHRCLLPGVLRLPSSRTGTLLLQHVDELTIGQQIDLYDWLTAGRGALQVVSLTEVALEERVNDGRFLESLFYRLNVVRLDSRTPTARHSTPRASNC